MKILFNYKNTLYKYNEDSSCNDCLLERKCKGNISYEDFHKITDYCFDIYGGGYLETDHIEEDTQIIYLYDVDDYLKQLNHEHPNGENFENSNLKYIWMDELSRIYYDKKKTFVDYCKEIGRMTDSVNCFCEENDISDKVKNKFLHKINDLR
jgi:hypothetical protein